jgi:hypothetical protein
MSEQFPTPRRSEVPKATIKTGMSLEQYLADIQKRQAAATAAPRPSFTAERPNQPTQKQEKQKPAVKRKQRKLGKKSIAIAGVGVIIAGGVYITNQEAIQDLDITHSIQNFAASFSGDSNEAPSYAITPLETFGEKSLAPNQCKDPEAVLMVATISGEYPLAPLLATTENPALTVAPEYMTEEQQKTLPEKQQDIFGEFITDSGYPEATLHAIPIALTMCEPIGANAITVEGDKLTINRSALEVNFEDPNGLFDTSINAVYQTTSASEVDTDSKKAQYMSMPDPSKNMFLGQSDDEVYTKSVTDLMTNLQTPQQLQVLLATMESQAVTQLDNVVDGHENISYPDGSSTLQETIDRALVKRLVGDTKTAPAFTGNYNVQMDVAKDPTTKQPISNNDANGVSPLKNIDPAQTFSISDITIEYGAMTEPTIIEEPVPTETPTVAPVANDAP